MSHVSSSAAALEGLNEPQRAAVAHGSGPMLILAGPGSGKTRVITHRIAHLVRERRIAPWRLLAVTFTNKAAREMRDRAEAMLGEDASDLALGTFHAMCARWLRVDGEELGLDRRFVIYDDGDQMALMKSIIEGLNLDPRKFAPRSVLAAISKAKSEMVRPEAYAQRASSYFEEVVARAYRRYDERLKQSAALDFDDLLLEALRLLQESPAVAEKYRARYEFVMVDEFQDTNPVQYLIASELAGGHRNLCVVGDPDQSIYSWRAADARNVQHFERDFPECRVFLLEQNYRSTGPILEAAEAVIRKNPDRRARRLWTDRSGGDLITAYEAYNDDEEAEFIAREAQRLVLEGLRYGDQAVLYRTNAQSRAVEDALMRNRIPYRIVGGIRFYQRREIKDVIAYLRLVQNRLDEASLLRVINVPARGIGERTVQALRSHAAESGLALWDACELAARGTAAGIGARPAAAIRGFVQLIESLREHREDPLGVLLNEVLERTGYLQYIAGGDDAAERAENLEQLRAAVAQYEEAGAGRSDLAAFLEGVALIADVDELQGEVDAVTLITLHAAKGLEFRVVFLVGLEEGVLPHIRSFDDPRQMEEERRLAYVGITRARDRLYLLRSYRRFALGGHVANPASRFLKDVPPHLVRSPGGRPQSYVEAAVALPAAPADTAVREQHWRAGDKAVHPTFGEGTVISVDQRRGDTELMVAFDGKGVKRISLAYVALARP